jgi:hypothetical protein
MLEGKGAQAAWAHQAQAVRDKQLGSNITLSKVPANTCIFLPIQSARCREACTYDTYRSELILIVFKNIFAEDF